MSKENTTTATTDENIFPKKWAKVIKDLPEFKEIADSSSKEELNKIILQCEGNVYTIEKEKQNDAKLNAARDCLNEFSAPYKDAIKVQMGKIQYCLFLLEQSGVNLDNQNKE